MRVYVLCAQRYKRLGYTFFIYKKKAYKKIRLKRWKSLENNETQFPKFSIFLGSESIFRRYCIQNDKDGIQVQVYNIFNECLTHFNQFISDKVKKSVRKSPPHFRE